MPYAQLHTLVPALFLALAVLPLQKPNKPGPKSKEPARKELVKAVPRLAPFSGNLAAAKALALERNVPIVAHMILENEQANDSYRATILPDAELIAASVRVIVIVAADGEHASQTIEEPQPDGTTKRRTLCSIFGTPDCAGHRAAWNDLAKQFVEADGLLHCPQVAVILPDTKVSGRINTGEPPAPSEIIALIKEAVALCGPGLSDDELAESKKLVVDGETALAAQQWPAAVRALQRVVTLCAKGPTAERARQSLPAAEQGLRALFEKRAALLVPGTVAEGFKQLTELQKACAGLALEAEIAARLKAAEGDKALQGEIAAYRTALEADQILVDARALQASDAKKARALVRKLFQKRFAATNAAAEARKLWPDVATEEDARQQKKGG